MVAIIELDFFKAEHAVLLDLSAAILAVMDGEPAHIVRLRSRMSRVLVTHLAKEDDHLYPALRRSPQAATALCAARFEAEMGDLAKIWLTMMRDWPDERILRDLHGFAPIMRPILVALERRIHSEEQELYPLCMTVWDDDDAQHHGAAA